MTSHYLDLSVKPDPETSPPQLLGVLHDRLHLALVQTRLSSIGVSFPGYSLTPRSLGQVLRLHGSVEVLAQLMALDWLKGLRDHLRIGGALPAPTDAVHRVVQRRQFKTNAERLRRRRMQRKGETAEQAAQAIPVSMERRPDLPYLNLRSRTSGQTYAMFIAMGPTGAQAIRGHFNSYGLSSEATIPWF